LDRYPDNTLSKFKAYLPFELNFDRPYEVALVQYSFPARFEAKNKGKIAVVTYPDNTSPPDTATLATEFYPKRPRYFKPAKNIPQDATARTSDDGKSYSTQVRHFTVPRTEANKHTWIYTMPERKAFYTIDEFITFLNKILHDSTDLPLKRYKIGNNPTYFDHVFTVYKKSQGIEFMLRDDEVSVFIQGSIARILGFDLADEEWLTFLESGFYSFPNAIPSLTATQPNLLNIYCSIVEPIVVGGKRASLLKCIPTNAGVSQQNENSTISNEVISRQYLPVNVQTTQEIEIQIRDATGEQAPFLPGLVYLRLHFRPRKD
jgi:hypothetical protein